MPVSQSVHRSISGRHVTDVPGTSDQKNVCAQAALMLEEAEPVLRPESGLNIRPRLRRCQTAPLHMSMRRCSHVVPEPSVPGGAVHVLRG